MATEIGVDMVVEGASGEDSEVVALEVEDAGDQRQLTRFCMESEAFIWRIPSGVHGFQIDDMNDLRGYQKTIIHAK